MQRVSIVVADCDQEALKCRTLGNWIGPIRTVGLHGVIPLDVDQKDNRTSQTVYIRRKWPSHAPLSGLNRLFRLGSYQAGSNSVHGCLRSNQYGGPNVS